MGHFGVKEAHKPPHPSLPPGQLLSQNVLLSSLYYSGQPPLAPFTPSLDAPTITSARQGSTRGGRSSLQ